MPAEEPRGRYHSVSSTTRYEECPKAYEFGYVQRVQVDRVVPEHWRFGTVVHAGLEAANRAAQAASRVAGEYPPMSAYASVAEARVRESWEEEQMPPHGGELERAVGMVIEELHRDGVVPAPDILGVEHRMVQVTDDGTIVIGYVDRLLRAGPDAVEIQDYKVTSRGKRQEELLHDLQLNTYAWMALREFPWARHAYGTHVLPPTGERQTVKLTEDGMLDAVSRLECAAESIEMDRDFRPRPGEQCSWCVYKGLCPAWQSHDARADALGEVARF